MSPLGSYTNEILPSHPTPTINSLTQNNLTPGDVTRINLEQLRKEVSSTLNLTNHAARVIALRRVADLRNWVEHYISVFGNRTDPESQEALKHLQEVRNNLPQPGAAELPGQAFNAMRDARNTAIVGLSDMGTFAQRHGWLAIGGASLVGLFVWAKMKGASFGKKLMAMLGLTAAAAWISGVLGNNTRRSAAEIEYQRKLLQAVPHLPDGSYALGRLPAGIDVLNHPLTIGEGADARVISFLRQGQTIVLSHQQKNFQFLLPTTGTSAQSAFESIRTIQENGSTAIRLRGRFIAGFNQPVDGVVSMADWQQYLLGVTGQTSQNLSQSLSVRIHPSSLPAQQQPEAMNRLNTMPGVTQTHLDEFNVRLNVISQWTNAPAGTPQQVPAPAEEEEKAKKEAEAKAKAEASPPPDLP
jgi:hypothetical protein